MGVRDWVHHALHLIYMDWEGQPKSRHPRNQWFQTFLLLEIEKQTPPTSVSKVLEKIKRQMAPSPLRSSQRCKTESSTFVQYQTSAQISNVQLAQYCTCYSPFKLSVVMFIMKGWPRWCVTWYPSLSSERLASYLVPLLHYCTKSGWSIFFPSRLSMWCSTSNTENSRFDVFFFWPFWLFKLFL